jgi:hypothetical protein
MPQGFYWESYRYGHLPGFGDKRWYQIVRDNAATIRDGRFDLIWLPPPLFAGGLSAGYNPKEYFRLDNSYGSLDEHRAMLVELLSHGVEPVADIVINHRDGMSGWADFKNPDWGVWAICETDEAFRNQDSGRHGALYVRIGGSDAQWQPSMSNYGDYREYAQGAGWKVWVALPGNPSFRQAPAAAAWPIPIYVPAHQISAGDVWDGPVRGPSGSRGDCRATAEGGSRWSRSPN